MSSILLQPFLNEAVINTNNNIYNLFFPRLQKARAVLCDDSKRKSYDCWRKSGLKEYISFDNWTKVNAQSQLHWGLPSKKKMLTGKKRTDQVYIGKYKSYASLFSNLCHLSISFNALFFNISCFCVPFTAKIIASRPAILTLDYGLLICQLT